MKTQPRINFVHLRVNIFLKRYLCLIMPLVLLTKQFKKLISVLASLPIDSVIKSFFLYSQQILATYYKQFSSSNIVPSCNNNTLVDLEKTQLINYIQFENYLRVWIFHFLAGERLRQNIALEVNYSY